MTFPDLPDKLGLPSVHSDHWDPVLSAMEETGLVLAQHFGSGGFRRRSRRTPRLRCLSC
ncbi:putative amidohydrolase 2 [Mycobacterium xenopi 3993]|nr:putative amidohydrolase 2 [Mycobacterium xenopi 3993]